MVEQALVDEDFNQIESTDPNSPDWRPKFASLQWADNIRKETKKLAEDLDRNYLKLARNLWIIFDTPVNGNCRNNPWWQRWGYGQMREYEERELGINAKRAERLRRIWFVIGVELKDYITPALRERILNIGLSKVRELVRPGVLNSENIDSWITKAENMTYLGLLTEVNTYLSGRSGVMQGTLGRVEPVCGTGDVEEPDHEETDPEVCATLPVPTMSQTIAQTAHDSVRAESDHPVTEQEKIKNKYFPLYPDQWDTVYAALERASELSGSKKEGHNLSLICLDFLATNEFKKASMEQTQRFLIRLERALGLKFIAMTPKDHEIVYGYKLLERIMQADELKVRDQEDDSETDEGVNHATC